MQGTLDADNFPIKVLLLVIASYLIILQKDVRKIMRTL